jgi:hypothetical protein
MRTQLSNWQIKSREERDQMKYVSVSQKTIAHSGNSIVDYEIPFPDGVDGFMVKTIRVTSEENVAFIVDLMDGETGYSIYESLEEIKFHYDQVDIPYKPSERTFFVRIHNKGNVTTRFTIDIRGIEVT